MTDKELFKPVGNGNGNGTGYGNGTVSNNPRKIRTK